MARHPKYFGWLIVLMLVLAACGGETSSSNSSASTTVALQGPVIPTRDIPTATDTPTTAPTPTETPIPSETLTPSPEPTDTAIPTDTAVPTDTATYTPTDIPTDPPTDTPTPIVFSAPLTTIFESGEGEFINIGNSVSGQITETQTAIVFPLNGIAGESINISMQATSGNLDPFLIVLDPAGHELARNDDDSIGGSFNSLISGLRLTETGTHAIVATRFQQRNGISTGAFNLSISSNIGNLPKSGTFADSIDYNSNRSGVITTEAFEQIFAFEGNAGDTISIRMSATSGELDTLLRLTDNLGNQIASNDDDLGGSRPRDSFIRDVILPKSGGFSIIATRFQPSNPDDIVSTGNFLLELTVSELNTADVAERTMGILDLAHSGTIFGDELAFDIYIAGDVVNDVNEDVPSQAFFTYILPPLPEGRMVDSATLQLSCAEFGLGFEGLRLMSVYQETFEVFDVPIATAPGVDVPAIVKLDDCLPIHVDNLVAAAYANGTNRVQFRFRFEAVIRNRENDNINITNPILAIRTREG